MIRLKLGLAMVVLNINVVIANPLIGTWQFVKGEYATDKGLVTARAPELSSVKIISKSHFSYITQNNGKFLYAGGGSYQLDNTHFTEHVEYGNVNNLIGKSMAFTYQIEQDLWHHTLHKNGKLVEREVWQKIN
ncbi:hypothetical protein [Pseudoalteromonas aurantia]|uniref:DUF4488 domain-containing protein n=1 Tax=Pseudoalteromonas aurantia 208 TaxID=1314867 RepID=A0ABR9ECC8_9GAMM|nr:hypothetical protein [Pseudoalteromonas aurantia]MBE0367999.1 hypothetical protein [Pseudoalteromonas aurantia 208]